MEKPTKINPEVTERKDGENEPVESVETIDLEKLKEIAGGRGSRSAVISSNDGWQ